MTNLRTYWDALAYMVGPQGQRWVEHRMYKTYRTCTVAAAIRELWRLTSPEQRNAFFSRVPDGDLVVWLWYLELETWIMQRMACNVSMPLLTEELLRATWGDWVRVNRHKYSGHSTLVTQLEEAAAVALEWRTRLGVKRAVEAAVIRACA